MSRRLFFAILLPGVILWAGDPGTWTLAQKEHFLETARVVSEAPAAKGITHTIKAVMTDGHATHAAHIQTVDIYQPLFKGKDGSEEPDFKDSWKFNVAAYRLAKLLRLTYMTPVSVPRTIDGKPGAVTWWIDGLLMDERERIERHISPPDVRRWNDQMADIRVFDQLIYNMDRSQENLLITTDWKAWMIDHTRSFRKWPTLRNPAAVTRCNPDLLRALQQLQRSDVERELGPFLTAEEIDGLMARRDLIVAKLTGTSSNRPTNRPRAAAAM